jgi:hypothetical protein
MICHAASSTSARGFLQKISSGKTGGTGFSFFAAAENAAPPKDIAAVTPLPSTASERMQKSFGFSRVMLLHYTIVIV